MRAQFLILSFFATPAVADVWQLHPELGLRSADVSLGSTNPDSASHVTSNALTGGLRLSREDSDSLWETIAHLETAKAGDQALGETLLRSRYQSRSMQSGTNYELTYRRTQGFDPLNPIIESAVRGDDQSFQSLNIGIYHQLSFDVANEVAVFVSGGKNREGTVDIEARDAQLSWDHHHSVLWTSRLRARYAEAGTKQQELTHEHQVRLSPKLSTTLSYGYAWQQTAENEDTTSHGALWGASLLFQTSGLGASPSAYQSVAPVLEITEEQTESMRGSAMYILGWAHSRDRRRVGDPYYYADMVYGSTKFDIALNQTIEAKGSLSKAPEKQFAYNQNSYQNEIMQATYALRHRFWSRYPDATLALSYRKELTKFAPQSFHREISELSYALTW